MSEFNEIDLVTFKERYKKSFPSFFKKVIDHYNLWDFTRESLETLKDLCNNYHNYFHYITDGRKCDFVTKEKIRNCIIKMSPEIIFYSEIFGFGNLPKKHLFILNWAIYFLLELRFVYLTNVTVERVNNKLFARIRRLDSELFKKELKDFKDYFFLYEEKCPTPFDSLTDEEFSGIESFIYHSII